MDNSVNQLLADIDFAAKHLSWPFIDAEELLRANFTFKPKMKVNLFQRLLTK